MEAREKGGKGEKLDYKPSVTLNNAKERFLPDVHIARSCALSGQISQVCEKRSKSFPISLMMRVARAL